MLPSQRDIEIPLLETLVDIGGQGEPKEIYKLVRQKFPDILDDAFYEMLPSGKINKWNNRVQWARQRLIKKGDMDSPARGIWRISASGLERLQKLGYNVTTIGRETHLRSDDLVERDELRKLAIERGKTYRGEKIIPSESVPKYQSQGYIFVKKLKSGIRIAKPKPPDEQFEDEIWLLLYKLGFSTLNGSRQFWINRSKPSAKKPRHLQIDVFAKDDDGHVFVVECKYSNAKSRRSMEDATNKFGLYRSQIQNSVRRYFKDFRSKILKVTFLIATRNIQWSQGELDDAKKHGIHVWRDQDIDHLYELAKLHSLIGDAVRYQLYATMFIGQRIASLENQKVAAIEGKAGENTFYQFVATPAQLLRISYVHHRRSSSTLADLDGISKTYQRMLKPRKVKEIGKFIDQRHYFPNSIIISFNTPPTFEFTEYKEDLPFRAGTLTFPNEYGSAWIIDGQHRLYGFARSTRGMDDPIPVVAFKSLSLSEQSKLFVEINKNQTNVETNLLWDLYGDIYQGSEDENQQEDLIISNVVKRLDTIKNSPFNGHIYIPSHGKKNSNRNLTMATVCQNIKRNKILGRRFLGRQLLEQDKFEEFAAERIAAFFRSVISLFPEDWEKGEEGYLRTNNGVAALLVLLRRTLSYLDNKEKSHLYSKGKTKDFEDEVYLLLLPAIEYLRIDPKRSNEFRKRSGQAGQMASADELSIIIKNEYAEFYAPLGKTSEKPNLEAQSETLDDLIKDTELRLREFIKQNLQDLYGDAWYRKGIPGGVKKHIEGRINQEIMNYPYKESELKTNFENRLDYTSLGHLKDVIIYGSNWSHFENVFKTQRNLEFYFKNYNDLRNAYRGHMREVDPVLMGTGHAAIRWIRQCLKV